MRFELDTLQALANLNALSRQDQEAMAHSDNALYANGTAMDICHTNRWKYFITFKEGSLPALWQEYQSLLALCPQTHAAKIQIRLESS